MKISVVTICYNSAATITDTLASVAAQSFADVEHIIIDGASKDGTQDIVKHYIENNTGPHQIIFISEHDKGIYDAMNKGVARVSGDIIAILNADDVYAHENVLAQIAEKMAGGNIDALLGDVVFFRPEAPQKFVRRYDSSFFSPQKLAYGWMPAHPAMFMKKSVYDRVGPFNISYRIAGDFDFVARAFAGGALRYLHVPEIMVRMRAGGISTAGWRSKLLLNKEVLRSCRENGIATNIFKILSKYPAKLLGFFYK